MARKKKDAVVESAPILTMPPPEAIKKDPDAAKGFEPVMYVSRAKAFTLWVGEKGVKKVQFANNGVVGTFTAKTHEECAEIEVTNSFKGGDIWRANGKVDSAGVPIRSGVRSSLEAGQLPVDPAIQKIIEDSNQAAKRPIAAE